MEDFRKKLQKNNKIYLLFILFSTACLIAINTVSVFPAKINQAAEVNTGLFAGLIIISLVNLIRNKKALSDDKILKAMYIRNTDERNNLIMKKASQATFTIIIVGLAVATIVSQYFSAVVSSTLSCCMAFILIVYFSVTAFYNRKI